MIVTVIVFAATTSVFLLGVTEDINESAPNVADTTGEFELETDAFQSNQAVRIAHVAGDAVFVDEMEIVVRASGPEVNTKVRLIDLPARDWSIDSNRMQGDKNLINSTFRTPSGAKIQNQVIVFAD